MNMYNPHIRINQYTHQTVNNFYGYLKKYIGKALQSADPLRLKKTIYIQCYQKAFEETINPRNQKDTDYYKNKETLRVVKIFLDLPIEQARKIVLCTILYPMLIESSKNNVESKVSMTDLYELREYVRLFTKLDILDTYLQYEIVYMYIHYLNDNDWFRSFLNDLSNSKPYLNLYAYGFHISLHELDRIYNPFDFYEKHYGLCNTIKYKKTTLYDIFNKLLKA